jgi:hypothetical protein
MRYCGFDRPAVESETSAIAKPAVSRAKYARVPSLLTKSECRPPL